MSPHKSALDSKVYPALREALEALESSVHRGYHLFCLSTAVGQVRDPGSS
jgi:hypothetical protein